MRDHVLLYGASGFTGRLILREALAHGLRPTLGGRTKDRLVTLARPDRLSYRVASVEDRASLAAMVEGVDVVLNAAGPFRITAPPLAEACVEHGAHYVDISGEFATIEALALLADRARAKGVMVMPGAGFDAVPTDCMAAWVTRRLPTARYLSIALAGLNAISRGSAETVFDQYGQLVMARREGRLVQATPGELVRQCDFGEGPREAVAITWGDVSSAYHTTGIPNITVYYEATAIVRLGLAVNRYGGWLLNSPGWKSWLKAAARLLPEGPTSDERAKGEAVAVVEATDDEGGRAEVRLRTPEVYSFTASTSVAIVDRVLSGDYKPGFQTPARAYGPDFVLSFPGVTHTIVV